MSEKHGDGFFDQACPSIAAGIVGDLLVDETTEHRRPQIQMPGLCDADESETLPRRVESSNRRCIGRNRWFEPRDRPLKKQLIPGTVVGAEGHKAVS